MYVTYTIAGNVTLKNFHINTYVAISNKLNPVVVLLSLAQLQFYIEHFHHTST